MRPEVIYEDQWLMICYKPEGFPTQSGRVTTKDIVSWASNWRARKGESVYIGLTGRLDQPVEGLIVLGKTKEVTADLNRQIQTHQISKHYKVRVDGIIEPQEATLTDYLERSPDRRGSVCVTAEEGKKAQLAYKVVEIRDQQTILDVTLMTGRFHQIRVQMAHAGYPIVNDNRYGNGGSRKGQLALCAYKTTLIHPQTHKELVVEIDPRNPLLK